MARHLSLGVFGLLGAGNAAAEWTLSMPGRGIELSAATYEFHMTVFYWCCAIALIVFGAMIYSLISHRLSSAGAPAKFSHSMTAEVIWTFIPIIILLLMAAPSADTLIRLEDSRKSELTIVVAGYPQQWRYEYPDHNVAFFSRVSRAGAAARRKESGKDPFAADSTIVGVDKPMIVPKGANVRVLLTSNAMAHAWRVPGFASKQDPVPGSINEAWFRPEDTGVFRGQCARLCRTDNAYLPVVVEVVEPDVFQAWLEREKERPARYAAAR